MVWCKGCDILLMVGFLVECRRRPTGWGGHEWEGKVAASRESTKYRFCRSSTMICEMEGLNNEILHAHTYTRDYFADEAGPR